MTRHRDTLSEGLVGTNVFITPELKRSLDLAAVALGRSRQAIMAEALEAWVEGTITAGALAPLHGEFRALLKGADKGAE